MALTLTPWAPIFSDAIFPCTPPRLNDKKDPSVEWLEKLDTSLKWEGRSLILVAVGVPMYFFYPPVGLAIGVVNVLAVMIMVSWVLKRRESEKCHHMKCKSPILSLSPRTRRSPWPLPTSFSGQLTKSWPKWEDHIQSQCDNPTATNT